MEKQKLLSGIREYYIPLQIKLEEENKLNNSCLPIIIKGNKNKLREIFNSASRPSYQIKKEIFDYLLRKGYLIEFEDSDKYIPSAKGIWFYETYQLEFKKRLIYDYITEEFIKKSFSSIKKNLNDTHKLILFALLSMRCFSKESCINLIESKKFPYWKEIFEKCMGFLGSNNYTQPFNTQEIFDKKTTRHPVLSMIIPKGSELPSLTKFIFKGDGKAKFYLNVLDDKKNIDKEKLNILFSKIFGNISLENKKKILEFSNEMLKDYDIKIFDNLKDTFTQPEISRKIEEIILFS